MSLSLNETHKLVKDAGRGAGLSVGEADELATAAVFLEVSQLDGCGAAAQAIEGLGSEQRPAIKRDAKHWELGPSGDGVPLSSFHAGVVARDLVADAASDDPDEAFEGAVTIIGIGQPLLVLGLSGMLGQTGADFVLTCAMNRDAAPSFQALMSREAVFLDGAVVDATGSDGGRWTLTLKPLDDATFDAGATGIWSPNLRAQAAERGLSPDREALKLLRRHARKCLVAATEESRLKGAGAGTVDRD